MPLDPRAKRFLDMLATAGPSDPSRATLDERRAAFRDLMRFSGSGVAIGRVEDRRFPGPDGSIGVRIYTPIEAQGDVLPGLVYFHGGGLVAGSLDTNDPLCRTLANETGCRVVAVDYRLAPEHKFPAAVTDACASIPWVVENAALLGIERDRIGVAGDSAGGTLAAIACQAARQFPGARLAFQLLMCPIMDFAAETESRKALSRGYLLDKAMMDRDLAYYLSDGMNLADPRISPLRAPDLAGLPPAYIHTAEFDPLRDEGQAYAERLRLAHISAQYTCHPGMIHLFYGMPGIVPYARSAMKLIGAQIRTALG